MKAVRWSWLVVLSVPLAIGCKGGNGSGQPDAAAKQYPIKGKVVSVDAAKPSVKLDHEEIPELKMKAMVMDYAVDNAKMLEGLKAGDEVQGHFRAESGKYIITHLEKR